MTLENYLTMARNGDYIKLIAALEADIRKESAKKSGRNISALKTIEKLLHNARKHNPRLGYAWLDSENRQCICDGFRAFRFNAAHHLPLEKRPDDAGDTVDLGKIIPDDISDYEKITLPALNDVKTFVKIERAKVGNDLIVYDLGFMLPRVDARYLVDVLSVIGDDAEAYVRRDIKRFVSGIFFKSSMGDAFLLPIRKELSPEERETFEKLNVSETSSSERAERRFRRRLNRIIEAQKDENYGITPDEFEELVTLDIERKSA